MPRPEEKQDQRNESELAEEDLDQVAGAGGGSAPRDGRPIDDPRLRDDNDGTKN